MFPLAGRLTVVAVLLLLDLQPVVSTPTPASPGPLRCVQCSPGGRKYGDCIAAHPPPSKCKREYRFCSLTESYDEHDGLKAVVRSCSPTATGTGCVQAPDMTRVCQSTCNWDGCNASGATAGGFQRKCPVQTVAVCVLLLVIFGAGQFATG